MASRISASPTKVDIMSSSQKGIVAATLFLFVASLAFAPYEFTAHNESAHLANGSAAVAIQGVTYAPLWAPPPSSSGLVAPSYAREAAGIGAELDDLHFAPGRIAIEWLELVMLAAVAIASRATHSDERTKGRALGKPKLPAKRPWPSM